MTAAYEPPEVEARKILGSFLFTGDDVHKPARVLSGGEKTRLASPPVVSERQRAAAGRADEQPDPASREEILGALANFEGAVVLVSHDPGAVAAWTPSGCS